MIPLNRDRTGAINIGTNFKRLMTGQQLIRPMTNQDLLYHQADACMWCVPELSYTLNSVYTIQQRLCLCYQSNLTMYTFGWWNEETDNSICRHFITHVRNNTIFQIRAQRS